MKEKGCAHCKNSSIHYHIDTRGIDYSERFVHGYGVGYDIWSRNNEHGTAIISKMIENEDVVDAISFIFEDKKDEIERYLAKMIKYSGEFMTIEWRFGSQTLSYSKIIMQILVAIHITNCMRYKNKEISVKHIKMLKDIAMELY